MFPIHRPRRLRCKENLKRLVQEYQLSVNDLIYPLFVVEGSSICEEIPSMPGVFHLSVNRLQDEVEDLVNLGIPAVIVFGVPDSKKKDERGSESYKREGIAQRAVRKIGKLTSKLVIITDLCLCAYMTHGHCGVVEGGRIKNDETLEILQKIARSHAEAGADMVAPSGMIDGQVKAIREALDKDGFPNVAIMSYSAKYNSSFYGPFREAAHSPPQFGDRSTYQMAPPNVREAIREVKLDIEEGADIVMVKPALAYLDVINKVKDVFNYPVAAYNVSGEYGMVKAAAKRGWIEEKGTVLEILTGLKRAGADMIITYHAKEVARWLSEF